MRVQFHKLIILPLLVVAFFTFIILSGSVVAAPPDNPIQAVPSVAQAGGVTLEKQANVETVTLGQAVTYTLRIANEGTTTINPTLTDALPDSLVLQLEVISATLGTITYEDNTISWSGSLEPGDESVLTYAAIPPTSSTGTPSITNLATLQFGETTLDASATIATQSPDVGIWRRFVNGLAIVLVRTDGFVKNLGVPYSFGFAIILFTVAVRLATFPLNMQQIKSSKAMQALQPEMKALQEKYKNDREALAQEQMKLYREHGVNPLGGCLPMLVQMPIWFALYQSLLQLSAEGLLRQGFFWLPSLSGPVASYAGGISWLWPLPPSIGWPSALAYLVLPVLLVVSQLFMQQMLTPPATDPQQQSMQSVMKFMPFMFGYFALIVPSGLTLYWFTSNLLAMAQQYFTRTQLDKNPPTVGTTRMAPASAVPAPAEIPPSSGGENKKKHGKSKRKSKRKR
ncbi:MAG: membrane protein insertase YidC [Chloroflexota bacterium]